MEKVPKEKSNELSKDNGDKAQGISRRELLGIGAGLAVAVPIGLASPRLYERAREVVGREALEEEILKGVEAIHKKFGIKVSFEDISTEPNEVITSSEPLAAEKLRSLTYLKEELDAYPRIVFQEANFNSIVVRNEIKSREKDKPEEVGLYGQARTYKPGLSDQSGEIIMSANTDTNDLFRSIPQDEDVFRRVINHEIFHLIDNMPEGKWPVFDSDKELFGEQDPKEVRGIVYGTDIVKPGRKLPEILANFPELNEKIKAVKAYVAYTSHGLMDEDYWERRKRPEFISYSDEYFVRKARLLLGGTREDLERASMGQYPLNDDDYKYDREWLQYLVDTTPTNQG